jgi:hypothetical protein
MFYFSICLVFRTVINDHASLGYRYLCFPAIKIFLFPVSFVVGGCRANRIATLKGGKGNLPKFALME